MSSTYDVKAVVSDSGTFQKLSYDTNDMCIELKNRDTLGGSTRTGFDKEVKEALKVDTGQHRRHIVGRGAFVQMIITGCTGCTLKSAFEAVSPLVGSSSGSRETRATWASVLSGLNRMVEIFDGLTVNLWVGDGKGNSSKGASSAHSAKAMDLTGRTDDVIMVSQSKFNSTTLANVQTNDKGQVETKSARIAQQAHAKNTTDIPALDRENASKEEREYYDHVHTQWQAWALKVNTAEKGNLKPAFSLLADMYNEQANFQKKLRDGWGKTSLVEP